MTWPMENDPIRAMAEERLGLTIPDEEWTPELRKAWKDFLHIQMYSGGYVAGVFKSAEPLS